VLSKHTKKLFEEAIAITKDLLETFGAIWFCKNLGSVGIKWIFLFFMFKYWWYKLELQKWYKYKAL
jgi:hypothetical protein